MQILKFRSFVFKEQAGFVILFNGPIPEIVFEDILYQLFQSTIGESICPQIHYFSTTDQILEYKEMLRAKDYVYVHFKKRVQQYEESQDDYHSKINMKMVHKFKLGDISLLAQGIQFQNNNIYVISESSYELYDKQIFRDMLYKKIASLRTKQDLKGLKYEQYINELGKFRDNQQFQELKDEVQHANQEINQKIVFLGQITERYSKAKRTLYNVLKASGIQIKGIKDLL